MNLTIIVPVLNEMGELPGLLERLLPLLRQGVEVLIADGGSVDGSADLAECAGFTVVRGPRGRARQMNAGAAAAHGSVLLFLHADTRLPDGAATLVLRSLADGKHRWGRFDVGISGCAFMLGVVARMINLRSRLSAIATGDQAIFVTRAAFDAIEGFPDQPLMEDVELCKRLRALSAPACIARRVHTSGRRWESRGVWRTIWLMWRLRWQYWRGVPAAQLAREYR
ncbi:MAG: TIGR04283 family arsenosugar biosynthesis glycosyltransferase [Pseudomonadota bacterium]